MWIRGRDEVMRIYLAGAIKGQPKLNFPVFHRYAKLLRDQGHEVFNPIETKEHIGLTPERNEELAYRREVFKEDFTWICHHADAVALIPGWEKSKGATAERAIAEALGLQVIYLGELPKYEDQ